MRQGRAAAARQHLHAAAGSRHGGRGRHKDFGADAAARDERHLVTALVGGFEQSQHRTLRVLHAVQGHGAAGIHDEDYERTSLARHLLHPDVAPLDVHVFLVRLLLLARLDIIVHLLFPDLLEDHCSAQRRIQRDLAVLAVTTLGQHGLDVPAAVHGVDLVALAAAALLLLLVRELEHVVVKNGTLGADHELLRHLILQILVFVVLLILLGVILLIILLLLFLVLLLRRLILVHLVLELLLLLRRRGWRLLVLLLFHLGLLHADARQDGELDALFHIVRVGLFAPHERGMRAGNLGGKHLGTVSLALTAGRLLREARQLVRRQLDVREELAREQQLGLLRRGLLHALLL
mmetsp:Transcript_28946/g.73419  ORF Transcript_28946/g.73419 Transcript_28946/m.73419 type:complete len:349 (-) Transcript_28946:1034-2080(-)